MGDASFVQTSFLGGQWSEFAQGRMSDPEYKMAMNVCANGYPMEAGAWTRRQGFRYLAHTKSGNPGILRAFDFSVTQPYQIEFTDGFARFYAGLALVTFDDGEIDLLGVTTDSAGVFSVAGDLSNWANGDTVVFDIQTLPCSTKILCGRQFIVNDLDTGAKTFTLTDAITGAVISGTDVNYTATLGGAGDQVKRVFELATPYTSGQWSSLRSVQDNVSVLLLHNGIQPRVISQGTIPAPFQIATQTFLDGPYLAINKTTTTLTPSAKTGSITLTASSAVGINDGQGFLATDVGRLVRFQCAPPAWAIGTTYAKAALVLGSDNNIYDSVTGGNVGHDPTTDDGTNWELNETEVTWVWLTITAWTDTTHVTATVMDAASGITDTNVPSASFPSLTATTQWRLGVFGDTLGWPTCGVYHEGRLWLSGILGNRFDASYSNDHFNFSPTSVDGTVSDANAISEVLNATDVNNIFWMLSTEEGVTMGTQAGEWRIRASVMNDPITPSSIQAKRVSIYGCANIEPVEASLPVFVQRQQRKVLAHMPVSDSKYLGGNLTRNADDLTAGGVAEIRWQQEPNLTVWCRRNDGVLIGSTFQRVQNYSQFGGKDDSFNGWHVHALGSNRVVNSISTGPAFDGLSDALYIISNKTNEADPDFNIHWVECLMPLFDSSQPDWSAFFVDGGSNPCCATVRAVSRGDSFDGVTIYGLWNMNGLNLAPVIGGLDLGDRLVTDGSVDVPYLSDPEKSFTLAFLQAQDNGTDYGVFETDYVVTDTISGHPGPYPAFSFGSYRNLTLKHNYANTALDPKARRLFGFDGTNTVLDAYDFDSWTMISSTAFSSFLGSYTYSGAVDVAAHPGNGMVFFAAVISSQHYVARIDPANGFDLVAVATTGLGGLWPDVRQWLPISTTKGSNYMGVTGVTGVSSTRNVAVFNADTMEWVTTFTGVNASFLVDEANASLFIGPHTSGGFLYAIGQPGSYSSGTTFGLYSLDIGSVSWSSLGKVAPADIDASWTTFSKVNTPIFDAKDGTFIFGVSSTAGSPTHENYLVKMKPDLSIVWKIVVEGIGQSPDASSRATALPTQHWAYFSAENDITYVDTTAGTASVIAYTAFLLPDSGSFFDVTDGSITLFSAQASWTTPLPTPEGPYSTVNEVAGITNGTTSKFYFGADVDARTEIVTYKAATSAGATYTSQGQLLRPDYGVDAGARNGPAFGKKRRLHWWSAAFVRARNVVIGTIFNARVMRPVSFASEGGKPTVAPALFSGTQTNTIENDESFNAQIAWQISRPYPCVISAVGGYIESVDK